MYRVWITLFCQSNSLIPSECIWSWQCSPWAHLFPFFVNLMKLLLMRHHYVSYCNAFFPSWQVLSLTHFCSVLFHLACSLVSHSDHLSLSPMLPEASMLLCDVVISKRTHKNPFNPTLAFTERTATDTVSRQNEQTKDNYHCVVMDIHLCVSLPSFP